ncbi:MAG: PilN domain-containing protein [Lacipirellulaceae bacterium]
MTKPSDRRQPGERRHVAGRRSHADSRRVCVELGQTSLRAVVVVDPGKGEAPQATLRSTRWRYDASDFFSDQGQAELAAALRALVAQDRLAGCCVSFAVSGALCVNRATSGAVAKVEQDIAAFQERAQMYLSLGPGPKVTAVGRKAIDARHEHALVTVANEATLNLLLGAAESVGLVVDVVESALVSLARFHAATQPDEQDAVMLAQIDADRFEVGVSQAGQLLLEYRPANDATPAALGSVVDEHLSRLQRFCRRQYGLGTMNLDRLWLVGDEADLAATNSRNKTNIVVAPLPIVRLDEYWRSLDATCGREFAAALGLALRGRSDGLGVSPNLMEQIHARARTPVRPFLLRAAAPIAATLLAAAGMGGYNVHQEAALEALRMRFAELSPLELRGEQLGKQVADADTEIQYVSKMLEVSPHETLDPAIDLLAHCLPEDVWLKQLRIDERRNATITGASYTEGGVYDFVHYLEGVERFDSIALRGTGIDQTNEGPTTSFDLEFAVRAAATPATKEPSNG